MKPLRILTLLFGLLLLAGELARWWNSPRFLPMALDEIAVAGAMLWAAFAAKGLGSGPLIFAWGSYCGLVVALLVPTLDHLLHGPPKESAAFYAIVLSVMLLIGVTSASFALRLSPEPGQ